MDKIEVQGSLTFEHNGYLYRVTSDVYKWDPEHIYNPGEYVLYRGMLWQAKTKTPGAWMFNFEKVAPTDKLTKTATNDDLTPIYKSLDEIRTKLGLDKEDPDPIDPGFNPDYRPPCCEPGCGCSGSGSGSGDSSGGEIIDPGFTMHPAIVELGQRLETIETTYVRTINNKHPLGGNINIDFDGSVMPSESDILRWTDGILELKDSNRFVFNIDGTKFNVLSYDGVMHLGSDQLHLDLASVDTVTVNGADVATCETVVDLANDQNIHGKKHFDYIGTTESPQEDYQVPNSRWISDTIDLRIAEAVKPRLNEQTTFYINASSLSDIEDGTEENPFKTLKNAVTYIKQVDLNFMPVTLEFITSRYTDDSELLELPELGSTVKILSRTGLDTFLPPLYVTGHWDIDGVTLCDNRIGQCPLEIDRGYCVLRNIKVALNTPAPATDAIFVHNNGTLQLASGATLNIINNSNINVQNAIHVKAGMLIGNEDVHSNVGDVNTITISSDNSSFGVGLYATNGARCVYLENTTFSYPRNTVPYVAKKASVLQGLVVEGNVGESDASSIVTSGLSHQSCS